MDTKSYESMQSEEQEHPHFNYDSDAEPPHDEIGDQITVVAKKQVTKTILQPGANIGKPGRPYICKVTILGYFASSTITIQAPKKARPGRNPLYKVDPIVEQGEIFLELTHTEIELGSPQIPIGLWKAIQEMRKGERAVIMIKPKWGYNHPELSDKITIPQNWKERQDVFKARRVFFEVLLIDWTVRNDLHGDGRIMKTILHKGIGYDRPTNYDEISIDIKVYQQHTVLYEALALTTRFYQLCATIQAVLESMKNQEISQSVISPDFITQTDPDFLFQYPQFDPNQYLSIDVKMINLTCISDLYKDGTVFYQSVNPGTNTACPYSDCVITLKVVIQLNGVDIVNEQAVYDLEQYYVPAAVRRVLKKSKTNETVMVTCTVQNHTKMTDHIPDKLFQHDLLSQQNVKVILTLVKWEQKEYVFKLQIQDKIERVTFLKQESAKCFNSSRIDKALKIYKKIKHMYDTTDIRNNFCKEDESTQQYVDGVKVLQQLNVTNLTNLAVVMLKKENYSLTIQYCDQALVLDPKNAKAFMLKGKSYLTMSDYTLAAEQFNSVLDIEPDNQKALQFLKKTQEQQKSYDNKSKQMAQRMFQ